MFLCKGRLHSLDGVYEGFVILHKMNCFFVCVPSLLLHLCNKKACFLFAGRLTSLFMQVCFSFYFVHRKAQRQIVTLEKAVEQAKCSEYTVDHYLTKVLSVVSH